MLDKVCGKALATTSHSPKIIMLVTANGRLRGVSGSSFSGETEIERQLRNRKIAGEIKEIEIWKRERLEVKILRTKDDLMPDEP